MTTLSSKSKGLPPSEYPAHVERVLGKQRGLSKRHLGQILLVLAGLGVAVLWLWWCAYSDAALEWRSWR